MITVRRAEERHHDHSHRHDVWLTFFPQVHASPIKEGFGNLEFLDESRLSPGGELPRHPRHDAEIVTFVRQGSLAWEDSTGTAGITLAGEFRRMAAGRGIRYRGANVSTTHTAHVFQIWLRPAQPDPEPSYEQKRFSVAQRRGALCVVGSPDGRRGSLSIHQNALLFSALLDPGTHVAYEIAPDRSAWLHIVAGEATLGEIVLGAGDGVGLTAELAASFTVRRQETEILLLDLGPRALAFKDESRRPRLRRSPQEEVPDFQGFQTAGPQQHKFCRRPAG